MKSKALICVVAVIALVGGFFLGRWHTATSWSRFFEHYVYQRDANDIHRHPTEKEESGWKPDVNLSHDRS